MKILKRIESDIQDEFKEIRKDLEIHLGPDFDISQKKDFLKRHVPKLVETTSKLLLDTLLNYLMDKARKDLKKADVELQNKFFEKDFRKRINDWVSHTENKLELDPNVGLFSIDPRLKQGLTTGGLSFLIGIVLKKTVFISVNTFVYSIFIILLSAIAIKITYDMAAYKSRETVKKDIDKYLENAELQINEWLKSVIDTFSKDFEEFCSSNGFKPEGK
jgi:hypothetical protein